MPVTSMLKNAGFSVSDSECGRVLAAHPVMLDTRCLDGEHDSRLNASMHIPTIDQLKKALHLGERIEELQKELASIFGKTVPKVAREAGNTVLDLFGVGGERKKPKFSKAARQAISAAQKKRWAKLKGKSPKPAAEKEKPAKKKKGKMSAAGRANIVAAQKARWAKIRAEKARKKS